MNITKINKLLSLNRNIELIGSNANKTNKYATDYDLQEYVKINNIIYYNKIVTQFQNIFKKVKKSNYIIITDFKAGTFNTLPIKWKYDDIINGFKVIDTKHIYLLDALQDIKSTVKIDLICFIDNKYIEVSCNYYFSKNINECKNKVLLSLMLDVKKYYHEKKFMKMLKRLISYRNINNEKTDDLNNFFNTNIGMFYQFKHNIDVFLFTINKFNNEHNNITTGITKKKFDKYNKIAYKHLIKHCDDIHIKINKSVNINQLQTISSNLSDDINDKVIEYIHKI